MIELMLTLALLMQTPTLYTPLRVTCIVTLEDGRIVERCYPGEYIPPAPAGTVEIVQ